MKRSAAIFFGFVATIVAAGAQAQGQPQPTVDPALRGPILRVQITPLTDSLRQHFGAPKGAGVLVGEVDPDGAGAHAGLRVGDVITAADGHAVASAPDILAALGGRREGDKVKLDVVRDRRPLALTLVVPRPEAGLPTGPGAYPPPPLPYRFQDGLGESYRMERMEQRLNELERRLLRLESQPVR